MEFGHSVKSLAIAAGTVVALWGAAPAVQAREVVWSVGVGSPGVQVGVTNAPQVVHARPIIVAPQPVYVTRPHVYGAQQPVYVHPRPGWGQAQPVVVMGPRPYYYYAPAPWVPPGHRHGWRGRHGDRWDNNDHGRDFDRRDHR